MRRLNFLNIIYILGLFFIYSPLVTLIFYSFNNSRMVTVWGGFSLRWYKHIIEDMELINSFINSLQIASLSATIALILGMFAALSITRYDFIGKSFISTVTSLPFVMPEIIIAISLLLLYVIFSKYLGWPKRFGMHTVIFAHATIGMSYVTILLIGKLSSINASLEEAAQDLGATPIKAFLTTTLPIMRPTILSSWVVSFTISLDDLIVATFTAGPGTTTLPMLLYSRVKLGVTPEANVLATFFLAAILVICLVMVLLANKNEKRSNI